MGPHFQLLAGALCLAAATPRLAGACYAPWRPPGAPVEVAAADYAGALLREADAVVRVRALRELPGRPSRMPRPEPPTEVEFRVLEVLKGAGGPQRLRLAGVAAQGDEYNPGPAPYRGARPSAWGGACFTYQYRPGAEYLLVMKREPRLGLTPYWAPIAPVNEQLRPRGDPWLAWVRRALTRPAPEK